MLQKLPENCYVLGTAPATWTGHVVITSYCTLQKGDGYFNLAKVTSVAAEMKSTKVQTLGAIALHATTDYTDDASIVGLGPLNWAKV